MKKTSRFSKNSIAAILFGIIFVWAVTAMFVSESFNLDCFYSAGKVYELEKSNLKHSSVGWIYDQESGLIQLTEDSAKSSYSIGDKKTKWNYMIFTVEELSSSDLEFEIDFLNQKGKIKESTSCTVREGENIIELPSVSCARYQISVADGKGTTFRLKTTELRQKIVSWTWQKVALGLTMGCTLYAVLICGMMVLKNRCRNLVNYDVPINGLQSFFTKLLARVKIPVSETKNRWIRCGILCFLFLSMHVRELWSANLVENMYKVEMVYCICLILLAVLLAQDAEVIQLRNWKNPFVFSWFVTAVVQCIGDFIVKKRYPFEGYIKIFVFGLLFFAWNNVKDKNTFLQEIITVLKVDFTCCLLFCIVCRPYTSGISYLGCYTNPNTFGMYLVVVSGALLQSAWNQICKFGKVRYAAGDLILQVALLDLLWKSQCRGAMLAYAVGMISGVVLLVRRKQKNEILYGAKLAVVLMLLLVPVGTILDYGLENVSQKMGTMVALADDEYQETGVSGKIGTMTVNAESLSEKIAESKWGRKWQAGSLDEFTSGRTVVWKAYVRSLNLFGHYFRVELNGESMYAHNEILQHVYNYGIFIFAPYVFSLYYLLKYAWNYGMRQKNMWIFVWNTFSMYIIMSMIDVTDLRFRLLTWLVPCLLTGALFEAQEDNVQLEMKRS